MILQKRKTFFVSKKRVCLLRNFFRKLNNFEFEALPKKKVFFKRKDLFEDSKDI
jgi:hypothetical protein